MQHGSREVRGGMAASALHDDHGPQQIQNPGLHDDFFDQMLSGLPSAWPDLGNPKSPWDASAAQKLFRIDLAGKPPVESQPEAATEGLRYASYDEATMLASRLSQSQGSGGSSPTGEAMMLQLNNHHILPAVGLSRTAVGGGVGESGLLPLPLTLGSCGAADPRIIVETPRDEMDPPFESPDHDGGEELYNGLGGSIRAAQPGTGQHFHHPQGASMSSQNYGGAAAPAGVGQGPAASASSGGGTPPQKQKVRARRGQATDPHSIAERLRRERIAERMKALQELVPNGNKTDKASMLDEIIDYVKFLQLQVKVLSMSRLGGAAAVAPLVADVSTEGPGGRAGANGAAAGGNNDSLRATEHRVAKMMEEDMGSAMQYLQGKGLCLMPISLASAISSAACRPSAGGLVPAPPAPPTSAAAAAAAAESPAASSSASALTVQSAAADATAPKR